MRNRRSRQAARRQIKRDVPGMICPRCEREPNLAYNLRPHVQRRACLLPFLEWQSWPNLNRGVASSHGLLIVDLSAVDKIVKRTSHPLKHVARFVLGTPKSPPDARFGFIDDSAAFFGVALRIPICLHLSHARAGKHSFCARNIAAVRSDVDRADRARSISQCYDPCRIAALVRAPRITDMLEARAGVVGSVV